MPYSLVYASPARSGGFARQLWNMAVACVHDAPNVMLLGLALHVFFVFFLSGTFVACSLSTTIFHFSATAVYGHLNTPHQLWSHSSKQQSPAPGS